MEKKQQVLLIHGGDTYESYEAFLQALKGKSVHLEWIASRRDWKNELQFQLGEGFIVYTPQMPNKQNAKYEEWEILFKKLLEAVQDGSCINRTFLGGSFFGKISLRAPSCQANQEFTSLGNAL